MSYQNILVEKLALRAEITIARPQALNALDRLTMDELQEALEALGSDTDVRAVILTGAGEKAFVAGADISSMAGMSPEDAATFASRGQDLGDTIGQMPQIVIAAVHGFALGGGCELALACDLIFASDTARFGQPEVKLGVIPGFGGTQRLARRVGLARAMELVTVGEPIDAAEALRIGLVNAVIAGGREPLLAHARTVAGKIAERAPIAVSLAKRAVRQTQELPLEAGAFWMAFM